MFIFQKFSPSIKYFKLRENNKFMKNSHVSTGPYDLRGVNTVLFVSYSCFKTKNIKETANALGPWSW